MKTLTLEVNQNDAEVKRKHSECELVTPRGGSLLITPPIGEDYWLYRVKVSAKQAIVGFPKFTTIGIGFAVEEDDWNTNLPYTSSAEVIYNHIKHNAKVEWDDETPDAETCLAAIRMIQGAAHELRGTQPD